MSLRRTWIKHLWAAAGASDLLATPGRRLEVDRILDRLCLATWTPEQHLYRVDAAVTVLTFPLHWFRDTGNGFLTLEKRAGAPVLRFGATSAPGKGEWI